MPIAPVVAGGPRGRRRRPSGEPPPLPRHLDSAVRGYLAALAVAALLEFGVATRSVLARLTDVDDAVTRALVGLRTGWLTRAAVDVDAALSGPTLIAVAWATIAALLVIRRFRHLVTYLAVWLGVSLLGAELASVLGRPRPTGVAILADWEGYAHPSRTVSGLALVLAGALYTLVPAGRWRRRGGWIAGAVLVLDCVLRLYLAVDALSDVLAGLAFGWALPVVVYRLVTPDEIFPVTYRTGRRAHLDVSGRRGEAIRAALDHQLGLDVERIEPFGLAGSAGSTPLRLDGRDSGDKPFSLFGKLYALNHLRSDRWYKLARTVLYGRLEDEKPFSTVRRLVMYEDHLLRLLRDAGLPTPHPLGVAEITPEHEYVIVMEFFDGAVEIDHHRLSDAEIDDGLRIIRLLWDVGVAHRDIKPSNVLVRDGSVLLIDVAFASLRPTPWRQAVDLADMMLTLALASDAEQVYSRALRLFAPEDVAEAFAATRSIALPTQLRSRLRADGRDLVQRFRSLAPPRRLVRVQLWSLRRVGATLGLLALIATALAAGIVYVQVAGLSGAGGTGGRAAAPRCTETTRLATVAQAVPTAAYLPCLETLPQGWSVTRFDVGRGSSRLRLLSDRASGREVVVSFTATCDIAGATPTTPRAIGARTYLRLRTVSPRYQGTLVDVFPGGCVTYAFDFERGPHIGLMEDLSAAVGLYSRLDLRRELSGQLDVRLDR